MRKSTEERKTEIIAALAAVRQNLMACIASLPAQAHNQPCVGFWTIKDLLAHLTGWDITNLQAVQEILNGQRPTFFRYYDHDWQTYNASLVLQYHQDCLADSITQAEESHRRLVEYLQTLSPNQILEGKSPRQQGRPVTIRNLLRAEAQDENKHCEQVRAFAERLSRESTV